MTTFERYLTLWVGLCIVAGVLLGHSLPGMFHFVASAEIAKVNLPMALLIWLMVVPMLLKIDFAALGEVGRHWRGIGVTLFITSVNAITLPRLMWMGLRDNIDPAIAALSVILIVITVLVLALRAVVVRLRGAG